MPSHHRLQQYAIAISILSLFYDMAEGVVSIVFGTESSSRALVFYGLQSAVEVISDFLVAWRFFGALKPGNGTEDQSKTSPQIIKMERIATTTIGVLLVALTFAAIGTSSASLAAHDRPSTTLPAILIAATSTGFTLLLYLAKRYLARALDSSTLNGEALCGLCCMQLSIVLLVGSSIYRVWKGGWWVDAATAIVIGLMFGWEGIKMVRWARNADFDGGICGPCHCKGTAAASSGTAPSPETETRTEKPKALEENPSLCSCSECCGSCKNEVSLKEERV